MNNMELTTVCIVLTTCLAIGIGITRVPDSRQHEHYGTRTLVSLSNGTSVEVGCCHER